MTCRLTPASARYQSGSPDEYAGLHRRKVSLLSGKVSGNSVQWIERLLDAGVRTLQLRIKDQRDEEVEADVVAAIALGRRYNARLFPAISIWRP